MKRIFLLSSFIMLTMMGQETISGKESATVHDLASLSTQDYKEETSPEFLPCTYKVGRKTVNNAGGSEGLAQYLWDHTKYAKDADEQGW